MTEAAQERRSNSKLYKAESMEFQDERLKEIIQATAKELAAIARTDEKLRLEDTESVKAHTLLFIRACEEGPAIPSYNALCRSFGRTQQSVSVWTRKHPDHPTTVWLEQVHDAIADALATASLRGLTNTIASIFTLKARAGWSDVSKIEVVTARDPLTVDGTTVDTEAIAARYAELPD